MDVRPVGAKLNVACLAVLVAGFFFAGAFFVELFWCRVVRNLASSFIDIVILRQDRCSIRSFWGSFGRRFFIFIFVVVDLNNVV